MSIKAFIHLAAVPMRKEPSDKSEMVNQAIYGESCSIIDENEKWYLIELAHDGYQGWIDKKQVKLSDNYIQPSTVQIELLSSLPNTTEQPQLIPAGAFVMGSPAPKAPSLLDSAKAFLKSPYLWGGRTCLGIDCSGFTQIVFRICGKSLLRDAYQQAEQGEIVSFLDEAKTGDLAFFDNTDGRITHVGIIISDDNGSFKSIIHASGEVRIDSLDTEGIFNKDQEKYTHRLRTIRRV
jgi:cell wall-associated NlpC family hydrolase